MATNFSAAMVAVEAPIRTTCCLPIASYLLEEDALAVGPLAPGSLLTAPAPLESEVAMATSLSAGTAAIPLPATELCSPPRTLGFLPQGTNAVHATSTLPLLPAPSPPHHGAAIVVSQPPPVGTLRRFALPPYTSVQDALTVLPALDCLLLAAPAPAVTGTAAAASAATAAPAETAAAAAAFAASAATAAPAETAAAAAFAASAAAAAPAASAAGGCPCGLCGGGCPSRNGGGGDDCGV